MLKEDFLKNYEAVYKDLYKLALFTLGNTWDAKDIVSDTVVDAYANISKLRNDDAFKPWIFRILSNKCKHKLREYIFQRDHMAELDDNIVSSNEINLEDKVTIQKCLSALKPKERLIVNMSMIAGYNSREIAEVLHMKDGSVRSVISRSISKMQQLIEK